ncbi:MAG TPA: hypothetical protein VMT03_09935 [Polyangia bacterium]|nr:hypothetical protein [Polyangia bacterium]
MSDTPATRPSFVFRAGVRIAGTVVTCDGNAATDLLFLSHAPVMAAHGRRGLPGLGRGRRQLLTTDTTLTLLGPVGERLRSHALVTAFGRPFTLGALRLELYPSGYLPGAASLLCEQGGRRLVYAGPLGDQPDVRAADAVCLDARWAGADLPLPARAEAEAGLLAAVRGRGAGAAPVLVVDPPGLAPVVGQVLAQAGVAVRTNRKILESLAVYRRALGVTPRAATIQRYSGRLAAHELLLWAAGAPVPAQAGKPVPRPILAVGPRAGQGGGGLVFPMGADAGRLVGYVRATGAAEAALVGAPDDHLAGLLRAGGIAAYRLGPPRQMPLFTLSDGGPWG